MVRGQPVNYVLSLAKRNERLEEMVKPELIAAWLDTNPNGLPALQGISAARPGQSKPEAPHHRQSRGDR
jgi:hypothetical protein